MPAVPRHLLLVSLTVLAVFGFTQDPALAASNPYGGLGGYDVSYPQCSSGLPSGGAFWIIGVNSGRPFTDNTCLLQEWQSAPKAGAGTLAPSFYINAAYSLAYKQDEQSACRSADSNSGTTNSKYQEAWVIGCSEALTSVNRVVNVLGAAAATGATDWWADVETSNSWSSSDVNLNRYTILGVLWYLNSVSPTTQASGIYSDAYYWGRLMGSGWTPSNLLGGDWNADNTCTNFTGTGAWLMQGSNNGFDYDVSC